MTPTDISFARREVAGCSACGMAEHCAAADRAPSGPLRGRRFVLASLLYFLAPATLALVGSAVAGPAAIDQAVGGLLGLVVGLLATTATARRLGPPLDRETCFEPR